jgi:hypothetical protein
VALAGVAAYASALRSAAEDATTFANAGALLDVLPSRIAAISTATEEFGGSSAQMLGALERFQVVIGSGKLDADIRRLTGDLAGFKDKDIVTQLVELNTAIDALDNPLERAAARARAFGGDAQEMGRLAKEGFHEAVEGAHTMSDETITELARLEQAFDGFIVRAKTRSKALVAESFVGLMHFFSTNTEDAGAGSGQDLGLPTAPGAPGRSLPGSLPTPGANPEALAQLLTMDKAAADLKKEISASLDMSIRMAEIWGSEMPEAITFVSPALEQLRRNQELIAKAGGDWADVLTRRVAAAVDSINAKFVNAVMLNNQLRGSAAGNRDQLMQELTATTNPNESAYDKRFNEIDQQFKAKLAGVDQTDRVSAAAAENAILEEMNLEVLKLQQQWEKTGASVDAHKAKIESLGHSYQGALNPGAGTQLPNGLVMPTAEQLANHRYFGPVDANGRPDAARMGGAAPAPIIINANNSVNTDGWDELVRRVEQGLDERGRDQGTRTRR